MYNVVAPSETSARVKNIVDTLLAAGIKVVLSTIIPGSVGSAADHGRVRATNALIKAWALTTPGVILNDWYMTLVDPTTGNGKSIYFADGTHPFGAGASRMGYALAKVLEPLLPKTPLQIGADGLLGLFGGFKGGTTGVFGGANPGGGSGQLALTATCYVPRATCHVPASTTMS